MVPELRDLECIFCTAHMAGNLIGAKSGIVIKTLLVVVWNTKKFIKLFQYRKKLPYNFGDSDQYRASLVQNLAFRFVLILDLTFKIDNKPSGADLGFSPGGGGGFSKSFRKFCRPFFLGRPNWFSELSQITKKTLFG